MIDVEYYRKENGECPFEEFVNGLPERLQLKMMAGVEMLAEGGPAIRAPLAKSLGGGLIEPRVDFGSLATRSFFFFVAGGRAVIANGFMKKAQKTPRRELRRARTFRKDWVRRHG